MGEILPSLFFYLLIGIMIVSDFPIDWKDGREITFAIIFILFYPIFLIFFAILLIIDYLKNK